jgi:hypothetical protein
MAFDFTQLKLLDNLLTQDLEADRQAVSNLGQYGTHDGLEIGNGHDRFLS